mgnify:CR=1 FL=1
MKTLSLLFRLVLIILSSGLSGLYAQSEFEPNNTILQNTDSNTFTAPVEVSASINNSSDDRDFFKIEFPYCAQWRLTLINPNGDPVILRMFLYNDQNLGDDIINGNGIVFNYNLGIPDPVFLNSGQPVYIQIDQTSGEDLGNYTLSITEVDSDGDWQCNNYFYEASNLPVDTIIETSLWGYDINGDPDRDYFKVQVPECGVLNIRASNIGGGADVEQDIQFFVYQPDTLTEIGSASSVCNDATVAGSFLVEAGEAYIKLDDRTGSLGGCQAGYDLSNTPFTLMLEFDISDPCECNNDFANACEIPINSEQEIKLWGVNNTLNPAGPQDRDYFKVQVPECGVLNITASNIGGGADVEQDIQFFVYQPDTLTEIGSASSVCNDATVAGSFLVEAGEAYIKLDDRTGSLGGCQAGYDLSNTPFTFSTSFSPYAAITSEIEAICVNDSLNFMASGVLVTNWSWDFGVGAIPSSSEEQNPTDILFTEAGIQTVVLTSNGCSTDTIFVQILPETPVPEISADGLTLTSSSSIGNQWFLNGDPITGATDQSYTVTENGIYTVCVEGVESCGDECSEEYLVINVSTQTPNLENAINLFPNPTSGNVMLRSDLRIEAVILFDLTGKNVRSAFPGNQNGKVEINVADLKPGLYFCKVFIEGGQLTKKLVVR